MKKSLNLFLLLSALVLAFQNCGSPQGEPQGTGNSYFSTHANGDSYEGKFTLHAPMNIIPGVPVELSIEGGTPPYNLSSDSPSGEFTRLSENRFEFILKSHETSQYVQVEAVDKNGLKALRSIMVLGINNWYFDHPTSIAALSNGRTLLLHKKGSEIIVLSRKGRYEMVHKLFEDKTSNSGEVTALFADIAEDNIYLADSKSEKLIVFNVSTRKKREMSLPLSGCGQVQQIKRFSGHEIVYFCEDRNFIRIFDLNEKTHQDIRPTEPFEGLSDIQVVEGNLFLTSTKGYFLTIDPEGNEIESFSLQNISTDEIEHRAFTQSIRRSDKSLLLLGSMSRHIHVVSNDGVILKGFGGRGTRLGQNGSVYDLILSTDNKIVVSDPTGNRLSFYELNGEFSHYFGNSSSANGAFSSPTHLSFDKENNLYVLDGGNGRIQVFNPDGSFKRVIDRTDLGTLSISKYSGFSLHGNSQLVLTDHSQNTVNVFDKDLKERLKLEKRYKDEKNGWVQAALIDDTRSVVVSCQNNEALLFEGSDLKKTYGKAGFEKDSLRCPYDVLVNPKKKEIMVLQRGLNRISVFDYNLVFKRSLPSGIGDAHVKQPMDFEMDSSGQIYIVDRFQNRVVVVDQQGQLIEEIKPEGDLEFNSPQGVTVSKEGVVAVSDTKNNRIQLFYPKNK